MKKIYLQIVFLTLLTSVAFAQVYVTPTGAGSKDGSSWSNAFDGSNLQTAINNSIAGGQVWVAKGTYKPTENLSTTTFLTDGVTPATDRDKAFILKTGVEIYGGFAGNEASGPASLAARDFASNETILSGDLNNNNTADDGDHYHVVSSRNASLGAILDGFTIQHGFANGVSTITEGGEIIEQSKGGAAYLKGNSTGTMFSNLIIKNNQSSSTSGGIYAQGADGYSFAKTKFEYNISGASGAAIYLNVSGANSAVITNCTFNNNKGAGDGGGAINFAGDATTIVNITNSTFSNNETTQYGGAIRISSGIANISGSSFNNCTSGTRGGALYTTGSSTANIIGCTFIANSSVSGGHYYVFSGSANVKNSTFTNGTSSGNGGAIYTNSSTDLLDILGSKFLLNIANGSGGGGAIYTNSNINIAKSEFRSNSTNNEGGAMYLTSSTTATSVKISNSLFYDNIANGVGTTNFGGGAIYQTRYSVTGPPAVTTACTLTAINNTFYANKSTKAPTGAISFNGASTTVIMNLYNNIFNANMGYDAGTTSMVSVDIRQANSAKMDLQNNLFQVFNQTSSGNDTFANNILNDAPSSLFASTTAADFNFLYPTSNSVVIEKGNNTLYAGAGDINTDTHLAGYARLAGPIIDMGAVEYAAVLPVTISTFTAKLANNRTQLRWTVGTEDNVNRYEVDRSQNGVDFEKVAEAKATNTSNYLAVDAAPQVGLNYYRLKTVDNDGKSSYYGSLQTVNVNTLSNEGVSVYPNPVKGTTVNVSMGALLAGNYQYTIVNAAGVVAQRGEVNYNGNKNISLTTSLPAGLYIMHLDNGSVKVAVKLIKQ